MRDARHPHLPRRTLMLAAGALALAACQPRPVEGASQVVDGLKVEYGVIEGATAAQAHPGAHRAIGLTAPSATPRPPPPKHAYHVTLAAFDAKTGARVDDAEVMLNIQGPGHPGHGSMRLDPMTIAGTSTYGGYVVLPQPGRYRLTFHIARPGQLNDPAKAVFAYERPQ